ncbi:hypothetical protein F4780DRAFT_484746 [Xylariomycetidae sp. FL0641]|nr:hypothetical protein F4780DRAFT_484746 [Xylariomycetidae sp. FL0641]
MGATFAARLRSSLTGAPQAIMDRLENLQADLEADAMNYIDSVFHYHGQGANHHHPAVFSETPLPNARKRRREQDVEREVGLAMGGSFGMHLPPPAITGTTSHTGAFDPSVNWTNPTFNPQSASFDSAPTAFNYEPDQFTSLQLGQRHRRPWHNNPAMRSAGAQNLASSNYLSPQPGTQRDMLIGSEGWSSGSLPLYPRVLSFSPGSMSGFGSEQQFTPSSDVSRHSQYCFQNSCTCSQANAT